jgi:hypothetical protein
MAVLVCSVDTATSGRATVVIAEPKPLIDSPAQNKPKFRVRSRPPVRPRRAGDAGASGSALMRQGLSGRAGGTFRRDARRATSRGRSPGHWCCSGRWRWVGQGGQQVARARGQAARPVGEHARLGGQDVLDLVPEGILQSAQAGALGHQ